MKVYMHPDQAWIYAYKNIALLRKKSIVIAESNVAGRTVEMTIEDSHLEVRACLTKDDKEEIIDVEVVLNMHDCRTAIMRMLIRYFSVTTTEWVELLYSTNEDWSRGFYVIPDYEGAEDTEPQTEDEIQKEREDAVYEREDDLGMAICDFLMAVMQLPNHEKVHQIFDSEILFKILDDLLCVLADSYEIKIYRPTFIGDESTGEDVYIEYPYELFEETGDAE